MTTVQRPPRRPAAHPPALAEATRRLTGTIERATRDRPHQAEHGTLIIGARARDIEVILRAIDTLTTPPPTTCTAPLDLDEAPTGTDRSR